MDPQIAALDSGPEGVSRAVTSTVHCRQPKQALVQASDSARAVDGTGKYDPRLATLKH